jgi:hypothetical protein
MLAHPEEVAAFITAAVAEVAEVPAVGCKRPRAKLAAASPEGWQSG